MKKTLNINDRQEWFQTELLVEYLEAGGCSWGGAHGWLPYACLKD